MSTYKNDILKETGLILLGSTIFSLGTIWFIAPMNMVTGGVSGLAIIIRYLSQNLIGRAIPLYVTTVILNIPLFLVSIKQRGFKFAKKSLLAVTWISFSLWFLEYVPNIFPVGDDLLLSAVFGGAATGAGVGLVLRTSATTGGSDMLASIIKYHKHQYPISNLILIIDGLIIISGLFVFGARLTMYALIAIVISYFVMNNIVAGIHFAKAAFIISAKSDVISTTIMEQMNRGITGIPARGMYTRQKGEMLLVVVAPKEIGTLRRLVQAIDPDAFLIISDVKEVLGKGFTEVYDSLTI